jgi:uncharacterized protein YlxW (UPF0749 family)
VSEPVHGAAPVGRERRRHDRADVLSTTLLIELTTVTVDPAYVEAAAHAAATGQTPRRGGVWGAALLFLVGLLAVVALRQTRHSAPQAARVRSNLLDRVERLTDRTDAERTALDRLRAELAADRETSLQRSESDRALRDTVRALELGVGASPVSGEGVVVQLSDADVASDFAAEGQVQDRDLQHAVNALWAAGAEAIAINGQRVGPLTAIRQAGDSVLVDYRPISSPYKISAIGNSVALETAFSLSAAMVRFERLEQLYRIGFDVRREDTVKLPGTASTRVLVARPAGPPANDAQGEGQR